MAPLVVDVTQARHTGPIVLDIGDDTGAVIVHTGERLVGREIEVSPADNAARRVHTEVLERRFGGHVEFAAVFAELPAGCYSLWRTILADEPIEVLAAAVTEIDWRHIAEPSDFRLARPEGLRDDSVPPGARDMLPARYREGGPVCALSMGSAPMLYAGDGQVAWDEMWTTFCDLALGGGPKHRDTLLDPATPAEVLAAPEAFKHVVAETERGLRLVTGLPTVPGAKPGWVGLQCEDEAMARWLLRAIAAENVSVRRERGVIYLPAAPAYRLEKEVKSVVTVVAKTVHHWLEHRGT